eukprot:Sspe_Gene.50851::Locus_28259_Transcript_1_1_Confidence_1.000_Length_799::g.50851::m.50851
MGLGREAGESKYFPPNYNPNLVPRAPKRGRNDAHQVRIMMPFGLQCDRCGEWIAQGKKFNSKKQNVEGETYLGIQIIRLMVKCPRCVSDIAIKTDPQNFDYKVEYGAIRKYEHHVSERKKADEEAAEKGKEEGDTIAEHNRKVQESKKEMSQLERLEELRYMSATAASVSQEQALKAVQEKYNRELQALEDEDAQEAAAVFRKRERETKKKELEDLATDDWAPVVEPEANGDDTPGIPVVAKKKKKEKKEKKE